METGARADDTAPRTLWRLFFFLAHSQSCGRVGYPCRCFAALCHVSAGVPAVVLGCNRHNRDRLVQATQEKTPSTSSVSKEVRHPLGATPTTHKEGDRTVELDKRVAAPWVWDERCEEAFTHIKHLIAEKLLLEYPDYSSEFRLEIHTDASKVGMGAALVQMDAKGAERIIELASRVTTPHEKKYDTVCELEAAAVVWALKKFRSYIHGVGCVVKTDNKALTWMQNQEHPCARVAHWQILLDDYGAVVEFRPGKQSGDVDTISRMPRVFVVAALGDNLVGWKEAQATDTDCQALSAWLGGSPLPKDLHHLDLERADFEVCEGILHHKEANHRRKLIYRSVVVPTIMRGQVMQDNHASIFAGHLSEAYTLDRIKGHFWWPNMGADITRHCNSCHECKVAKVPARKGAAVGFPMAVPGEPGEVMSMDFIGPLRSTRRGNAYILVMIDHLTGDVELKATKHPDAESAVRAVLRNWVCQRGVPRLCTALHIEQRKTTAYHPQADGKTERYNHILVEMLRIHAGKDKDNWDELLPMMTFAYRTATSRATGFSPFYLEHGRDARTPGAMAGTGEEVLVGGQAERVTKKVREAWRLAQRTAELIWQAWDDERTKATTATERKFRVGDLVYVLRTGGHKDRELGKLANKWKGPYRITSLPVNWAARLETMDGQKSPKLVNLGHLCKCHAIPEEGPERAGGEVHTSHNETPEQRDDWRSQADDQTQHERGDDAETEDPPDTQHDLDPKRSPPQGDDTIHTRAQGRRRWRPSLEKGGRAMAGSSSFSGRAWVMSTTHGSTKRIVQGVGHSSRSTKPGPARKGLIHANEG
ncbi:Transposon Ty3-I Gag-Pol polyprotein [Pelomyxa schiedti]|nr:Transposon Ty3-I Gag-Pol polyprotein [Pelomyxa schiedti]